MSESLSTVSSWPVPAPGAAAAVVGAEGLLERVGPDERRPWASVTKLLTALVVLDLVASGEVDLDEPAGPPGSSVRHLLAHASGLAADEDRVLARPGTRRVYSNRGYEVLGELVAERTGAAVAERVAARVLRPLGMTGTVLEGSPAHGAVGPLSDLARLAAELLAPRLLPRDLLAAAVRPAFPGLAGVLPGFGRQSPNDWGLGPELRGHKTPHWTGRRNSPATYGHFGRSGSVLWVDPDAGVAGVCLSGRDFGPWAVEAWPALADSVLAAHGHRTDPSSASDG